MTDPTASLGRADAPDSRARPEHGIPQSRIGPSCLVRVTWQDWDCPVLSIADKIDHAGAGELKRRLHEVLVLGGRYILVDLSMVTQCGELGAVVLRWAGGQARTGGGWLQVAGGPRFSAVS